MSVSKRIRIPLSPPEFLLHLQFEICDSHPSKTAKGWGTLSCGRVQNRMEKAGPPVPFAEVIADAIPFVGEAVLTYQVLHALREGGKAFAETDNRCNRN